MAADEGNLLVFIVLSTGLFLFVLSGEARPQLEPANVPPSRLFHQSVCSQRAAVATQQLTTPNWIQVVLCRRGRFHSAVIMCDLACQGGWTSFCLRVLLDLNVTILWCSDYKLGVSTSFLCSINPLPHEQFRCSTSQPRNTEVRI